MLVEMAVKLMETAKEVTMSMEMADAARCVDVNHRPVGNPKRKV
jgi:hypothetical protein